MKKAFKITANNQYVQQVNLPADIYTYQCNVLNPTDTYTFGLLTESGVWNYYEVEVAKDVWAHRAKLEFKTEEAVTAFSLCSANASVANPVYVQNPILAERAEFSGIATKSLEEYVSELESGLVTENCTATLANGVLTISNATADKGKVTLSIIEESSVISTQVFFEKGLTPSQSAKLEAISKGMTVIDGGYIQSNIVELGNPEEALITAGLSGVDNDSTGIVSDGKMPAFWAGGTYEQAIGGTAKAIIRHDGSSKFTDTEIKGTVTAGGANRARTEINDAGVQIYNALNIMNIRFGLKDGYAVMEYYDNNGNFLYDLGPNGITTIPVREEAWVLEKYVYLGESISSVLTNSATRQKYMTPSLQTETSFYRYRSKRVAGVSEDPINDGKIFKSESKSSEYIDPGVYMIKTVGMAGETLTEGTGDRIYPIGIAPENIAVYDRSPLYFVNLYQSFEGTITGTNKAYWNG